jgi:hypothetical protein
MSLIYREVFQDGGNQITVELHSHFCYVMYTTSDVRQWTYPTIADGEIIWHDKDKKLLSEDARAHIEQIVQRIWRMRLFL